MFYKSCPFNLVGLIIQSTLQYFTSSCCCREYEEFLAELEEEPATRQQINIYKDPAKLNKPIAVDADDLADPSVPEITLEEMLDDLTIEDTDMAEV